MPDATPDSLRVLSGVLRDSAGVPETVYVHLAGQATPDGWVATSLDVGSWRPFAVGDRLVALDHESQLEFLVEVAAVDVGAGEVFYRLSYLAELDPSVEPGLNATRSWLRSS